jgi:exodeoxyribonuclease VII small subunit
MADPQRSAGAAPSVGGAPVTSRSSTTVSSTTVTVAAVVGPPAAEKPPELGFDQILSRLRDAVTRLESGDLSLEQSLVVYEEGVQLARRGQQLLISAEKRIEILVSAAGGVEAVPFDDQG